MTSSASPDPDYPPAAETIDNAIPPARKHHPPSNMTVRVISGAVLAVVTLAAAYVGEAPWLLLVTLLTTVGLLEFYALAHNRQSQGSAVVGLPAGIGVLLGAYGGELTLIAGSVAIALATAVVLETYRHPNDYRRTAWQVFTTMAGLAYIAFPLAGLLALRALPDGFAWLLTVFAVTWGTDTCAYFGGRMWGKRKLAPRLSPKKTVEGAIAGVVGGFGFGVLFLALGGLVSAGAVLLVAICPFVGIAGDLLESALKRFFEVKDSHVRGLNIIPGHGGVLDRVDALILVTAVFYVVVQLGGLAG